MCTSQTISWILFFQTTIYLGPLLPVGSRGLPGEITSEQLTHLLDLAPPVVYLAAYVTISAGALLPHPFTLTRTSHLAVSGLLSVALAPYHYAWALPSRLLYGVQTFLSHYHVRWQCTAVARSTCTITHYYKHNALVKHFL